MINAIGVVSSGILGIVFTISAIPKLQHPKGFVLAVLEYRVLPPRLGRPFARLIPPLEIFIALLLLSGTGVRFASVITSLLLLGFMVAIGVNMARDRDLDCHCFGYATRRQIGWGVLLQDSALLALSIAATAIAGAWMAPESWSVLRLCGLVEAGSLGPFLSCAATTVCAALLLGRLRM